MPNGRPFPGTSKCVGTRSCSSNRIATLSQRTRLTTFSLPLGNELPRDAMAEYRLTDRVRSNLIDIYDFTESKFGAYQAEAYNAGLVRSFGLLADFPLIGQTADELAAGYRRFRFQSHLIFYTLSPITSNPCDCSRRAGYSTATF